MRRSASRQRQCALAKRRLGWPLRVLTIGTSCSKCFMLCAHAAVGAAYQGARSGDSRRCGMRGHHAGSPIARDWIRTGQAKRVIVIARTDACGPVSVPVDRHRFLAMGAATTNENVSEAALPFDDKAAWLPSISVLQPRGLIVESAESVRDARAWSP